MLSSYHMLLYIYSNILIKDVVGLMYVRTLRLHSFVEMMMEDNRNEEVF